MAPALTQHEVQESQAPQGINPSLEEAAQNLGANKLMTIWKVTLPLSLPGVAGGSLIVFGMNVCAYIIPRYMGGQRVKMMAPLVYNQAMINGNFPFAAAISVILLVLALAGIIGYTAWLDRVTGRKVV